ncbi:DUF86 domain-containing protein [Rhizobium sp. LCM 4573]|uniref:HepT-like ribonuclease domain-containing protein n=1 Tax=Rhizobium sp. LCM 4573 TaxID=1848291 RepID=UPI0008DA5EA0|nr:HepT-like ribonuclease domain-containing protein [Rhizobium sp. LCM 4573]OHV84439.1 hypothetical protein LCM4573_01825 [Rhizobium sp. LCM 4573]
MSSDRILHLLDRIERAASQAYAMIENVNKADFLSDIVLQRAVGMSLLMASETAAQLMKFSPEFIMEHPEIPWTSLRGMRNRIAHEYFDINLERVWSTVKDDIPELRDKLHMLRHWRAQGE